jgi:hypothetical protein
VLSWGLNIGALDSMFDCLSEQESKIKYFTDSNRVKRIEKYSFIWERLGDVHLFRILGLGLSRFFVSDELKNHIQLNKLTGLLLNLCQ